MDADNVLLPYREMVRSFPCKLGSTSYLWPGGYLENAKKLCEVFGVVQLLIFETLEESPVDRDEIDGLCALQEKGLEYVLHLPVPSNITVKNANPVEPLARVIETFRPLDIFSYVLHAEYSDGYDMECAAKRIFDLCEKTNTEPEKICVENLQAPFNKVWEAVAHTGVSICFDAGHLIYMADDPLSFIGEYGDRIRMAHIHGVSKDLHGMKKRDHRPLSSLKPGVMEEIFNKLASIKFDGPVIIENFSVSEMLESLRVLASLYKEKSAKQSAWQV